MYASYTLDPQSRNLKRDFILNNCFFGSAKLTKNADPGKHKYSDYGIGFDFRLKLSLTGGSVGKIVIIGGDMSPYMHIDIKTMVQ